MSATSVRLSTSQRDAALHTIGRSIGPVRPSFNGLVRGSRRVAHSDRCRRHVQPGSYCPPAHRHQLGGVERRAVRCGSLRRLCLSWVSLQLHPTDICPWPPDSSVLSLFGVSRCVPQRSGNDQLQLVRSAPRSLLHSDRGPLALLPAGQASAVSVKALHRSRRPPSNYHCVDTRSSWHTRNGHQLSTAALLSTALHRRPPQL